MHGRYKEKEIICNNGHIDLNIIPEFKNNKGRRSKKFKPTSETQKRFNERQRHKAVEYLISNNFKQGDLFLTITYCDEFLPESDERALKDRGNLIRKLRRLFKRKGLPDLKYIICTERGEQSDRLHYHMLINGNGLTDKEIAALWTKGKLDIKRPNLFKQDEIAGIAHYITKSKSNGNAYSCSRNLEKPKIKIHTNRITRKDVHGIVRFGDVTPLRKIYPELDYWITDCKPIYNEVNGYWYIYVSIEKIEQRKCRKSLKIPVLGDCKAGVYTYYGADKINRYPAPLPHQ